MYEEGIINKINHQKVDKLKEMYIKKHTHKKRERETNEYMVKDINA